MTATATLPSRTDLDIHGLFRIHDGQLLNPQDSDDYEPQPVDINCNRCSNTGIDPATPAFTCTACLGESHADFECIWCERAFTGAALTDRIEWNCTPDVYRHDVRTWCSIDCVQAHTDADPRT